MIVLIITAVRVKSMDSHRISGRILAENIAGPGMLRLVEQSMQARARKTSVTEIAVKERKHPQAALTFDDGPDIRYTPLLLDGLKERNVRVSFFLLGEKVEQYPELVERMQKEGHLVGNHTYHHVQLNKHRLSHRSDYLFSEFLPLPSSHSVYSAVPAPDVWCLEEKSGTMCGDASCILDDRYTGLEGAEYRKNRSYSAGTDRGWRDHSDA